MGKVFTQIFLYKVIKVVIMSGEEEEPNKKEIFIHVYNNHANLCWLVFFEHLF